MTIDTQRYDERPWYRQGWPWFLISFPAMSVVLGMNMLYLAHQTNNSLVVDDYYKQGKAISQLAVRDHLAAQLQLSAEVRRGHEEIVVQLSKLSSGLKPFDYPESLSMRWVHVTQSSKDGHTRLQHLGGGRYIDSQQSLPLAGMWRIHLQPWTLNTEESPVPTVSQWRLVSDRISLAANAGVSLDYR